MIDPIADSTLKALLPELFLADEKFTKLVIIPDDVLHQLPFSAIDIAKPNQFYRPLGKQKEVVRTHSIYDYLFSNSQSHRENIASDHIAVFANPVFEQPAIDLGMKPLDSSAKVVTSIKQHLNGEDLDIYIGKKATNQSLMNDQVRQAKLLHIASHGIYDKQTGIVGIATSVDEQSHIPSQGFLSLTHLMSKPFYSDLVVISGCETMLGKYYKGSGLNSMTRGFLSQGAGAVVGSLWKVPNNATVIFMEAFYRALRENNGDVSMALSKAKKHFIRHKNLRYRDPFYWAGFVLTTVNRSYEQISLNTKH